MIEADAETERHVSQTYPTNTTAEKMAVATTAIQQIDNNSKLRQRVISA